MVRYLLSLFALILSLSSSSAQTLLAATDVLDSFPPSVSLTDARGIVVVPRAGDLHGLGARAGRGVLFVKRENDWGDPTFVALAGSANSYGGEPWDLVLVFRTRRSLERVVNGDHVIDSEATAYARIRGSFTAVSLEGSKLERDRFFSLGEDRKPAYALRAKLTELTTPKLVPAAQVPRNSRVSTNPTESPASPTAAETRAQELTIAALAFENRDAILGAVAALGAWFATFGKRKH